MVRYDFHRKLSLYSFIANNYINSDYSLRLYSNDPIGYSSTLYNGNEVSALINYDDYLNTYDNTIYVFMPSVYVVDVDSLHITGWAVHRDDLEFATFTLHHATFYDDGNIDLTVYTFYLDDDIVFPSVLVPDPIPEPEPISLCLYFSYTIVPFSFYDTIYNDVTIFQKDFSGDNHEVHFTGFHEDMGIDYVIAYAENWIISQVCEYYMIPTNCCLLVCCEPEKYYLIT